MNLQALLLESLRTHTKNTAFYINQKAYTYGELADHISSIRNAIRNTTAKKELQIGLILYDDLETYAAIFACWLEGKAYVPINPTTPKQRNINVLRQAEVSTIITSNTTTKYSGYKCIYSKQKKSLTTNLVEDAVHYNNSDLAYIFFTSGTTGTPKGVPITFNNLISFYDAFMHLDCSITENDRCLQMFELTFDLSVMSFLIPILKGAAVYTIPKEEIKYSYIFELMEDHKLTFALMVPSILHYLRPYFEEIHCPDMKNSLFCGEALPLDITEEWSKCLPNAKILNVYGPTENTIFCTEYIYTKENQNKFYNGILSVGKAMKGVETIIIDEEYTILPAGIKGELCLAGDLLTPGYWKNEEKNKSSFFNLEQNGKLKKYYKTGDLCFKDKDGDIMYSGRVDFQAKIQGFRVELSEVELYAKQGLTKRNAIAIAFKNKIGNVEIGLVIEGAPMPTKNLVDYMKSKMPSYMIPSQIKFSKEFPLNRNGKIDRNKLAELFVINALTTV